jgi:calcineurin-like phosphoesterase family protein
MNEAIFERMNSCVKLDDTPYFLGDFCLSRKKGTVMTRMDLPSGSVKLDA